MSGWQAYVDSNLVGSGKVTQGAILGKQGGVWAKSSSLNISDQEQKACITAFTDEDAARANGVTVSKVKYFTLNIDEIDVEVKGGGKVKVHVLNGKKGESGCVLAETNQAVLVGIYTSPIQQSECTVVVTGLAAYLKEQRF